MTNAPQTSVIRFGVFELDLAARQLRKNGVRIKLQDQPFRVLQMLVERPGEIVTRDELREKLWPADTFVEFDHSLNTATQKIRQALSDSAAPPRFLETVPRVGYRFVGAVQPSVPGAEPSVSPAQLQRRPIRPKLLVGLALAAAIALALIVVSRRDAVPTASEVPRRFVIPTNDPIGAALISPDGRWVAYNTGGTVRSRANILWIQDLYRDEPRRIAGPGRLSWAGWSPDSSQIAYLDDSTLSRLPVTNWEPVPIATLDFANVDALNGSWSPDGAAIILSHPHGEARLIEVQVQGGKSRTVLSADGAQLEGSYWQAQYLPGSPGSRKIVYVESRGASTRIVAADLDSGKRQFLTAGEHPFYSPSGHLLFQARGALWAMPFSVDTLSATGPAIEFQRGGWYPSVAADGTLAYATEEGGRRQVGWKDRQGLEVGSVGQPQESMLYPVLSPDRGRVVVSGTERGEEDFSIWVHEVARPTKTRVTFDSFAQRAAWRPGGEWIAYAGRGVGFLDIFLTSADGSGQPRLLTATPYPEYPYSWSSDGRLLLFNRIQGLSDLWCLEVDENGDPIEERTVLATEFDELSPMLSPDDRFLAYESDKSGRHEVYVRTFPGGDREWPVSTDGGKQPRWRGDAREVYYVDLEGTLFAVPIQWTPEFSAGKPGRLFNHAETLNYRGHRYDVTPDGQRFLVVKILEKAKSVVRVVDNWFTELKQLERGAQ